MLNQLLKNVSLVSGKIHYFFQKNPGDIYKKILIVLLLLLLLLAINKFSASRDPNLLFDLKWGLMIHFNGVEKAYSKFVTDNQKNSTYIQHQNAHRFGLLLYKKFGIEAIGHCNDDFGYGCYHNLIGAAIVQKGLPSVEGLVKKCQTLTTSIAIKSCQHGIGHGLIGYFGYGLTGINQSIDVCKKLKSFLTPNDCGSGIFMEYNFQDMSDDPGRWRQFEPTDPYAPCEDIDPEFQPICYFQQSSWWLKSVPREDAGNLKPLDDLCSKLSSTQKTECYKGIFYYLGSYFEWSTGQVIKACKTLTSPANQNQCLIQSAEIFSNGYRLQEGGMKICQSLEPDQLKQCMQKIGL